MRKSDRALEQLWKDPNAKIDDFTKSFEQLRNDLDTGTLQYNAIVVSKISREVGILGILFSLIIYIPPSRLSQSKKHY